jgi:hypothetical protein
MISSRVDQRASAGRHTSSSGGSAPSTPIPSDPAVEALVHTLARIVRRAATVYRDDDKREPVSLCPECGQDLASDACTCQPDAYEQGRFLARLAEEDEPSPCQ